ncbi:hypothetical protein PILCRDRAFT_84369 [Piloderma croceum F 1598]|uniref:Uncharacterized protein n=1 Tax=Piloderma croceum (strain F 1598) TaxID=765440 RepID=A0A0C3GF24_PILCF|nr:hypothetical protein PILCRDRAFT_84369 [Piloderma croceum F 1598]
MTATPRKLVHWALDVSLSQFGSPYSDASSDSVISTSSLQYINSQLVAHGFAPSPGLSLDGLSNADMERVVKCLLGMLSQRVEDMSRAEDLTTKLRTLSYDHERLITMHRAATEKAANAEREMNLHKSRLASSTRTLNTTLSEHKQTSLSLSRTRQTLFALRQSHISELKKKEKEIEKMVDKWSRVADAQVRLGAVGSGWVNSGVVDAVEGVDVDVDGKGEGFLEVALEQAEKARSDLLDENGRLRKWVVGAVNDVQAVLHLARSILVSENQEEPTAYTQTTLFPLHPPAPTAANEKLTGLKSPRKSPGKPTVIVGGALGSRKTQRVLRRSSGFGLGERVEPSFETEVIPSAFPITAAANTKPGSGRLSQSLLPTSFVLPPPSPHSSLPRVPALLSSVTAALPALKLPALKLAAAPGTNVDVETYPTTSTTTAQKASSPDSPHAMTNTDPNLITPPSIRRPFPMAKPYASKMVHAYSPARPSPLSRILMLNEDSLAEPLTSSPSSMDDLVEEEEEESPLKEKKVEVNVNPKKTHGTDSDGDAKRFTTKEKGKSRAVVGSVQVSLQKSRTVEKENQVKMKSVRGSSGSSSSSSGSGSGSSGLGKMKPAVDGKKAVKPASSAATASSTRVGMKLPPGKGGARRVPIDSAEAAPIGPGWRK